MENCPVCGKAPFDENRPGGCKGECIPMKKEAIVEEVVKEVKKPKKKATPKKKAAKKA